MQAVSCCSIAWNNLTQPRQTYRKPNSVTPQPSQHWWHRRKTTLDVIIRPLRSTPCVLIIFLLLRNLSFAQDLPLQNDKAVIRWLQQNAIPIHHVDAGNEFSDLQPLKRIWENVKVVGLGEATHATREFFQIKHRLFEFLVKEMNFNAFALEASTVSCEPINDYVLYGKGDRATALTGQGYSLWDTEEFADLIDWMHRYNKGVNEDKKVRFYGLDVAYNQLGREKVLAYLQKYAPEQVAEGNSLFSRLSAADEKWPMRIGEFKEEAERVLPRLHNLIEYLNSHKTQLTSASSSEEFRQIVKYTEIMEQFVKVIITYPLRTRYMAQNLLTLMKEIPHAKFIVSAHNRHINVIEHIGDTNLGHDLREKLGDQYYAVLFETYQGSYQTRTWKPETRTLSSFVEVTLPSAPEGSLSWYLGRAGKRNLFLDLRRPFGNKRVEYWFKTPQLVNDVQWVYQDNTAKRYLKVNIKGYYDGILFVENTTRARPTKNASEKADKEIGF